MKDKIFLKWLLSKRITLVTILGVILLGFLSRMVTLGNVLWDKYLGDLLYSVMFYYVFSLFLRGRLPAVFSP